MSSSSQFQVGERTFALQLKIHGKGSERSLKKWLLGIQGIRTVNFDIKKGVVVISGTIEPLTLVMMLENYGVKAEIIGQQRPTTPVHNNEIIVPQSKAINPVKDQVINALLEHLPRVSAALQTVEVKFTFADDETGGRRREKTLRITSSSNHDDGNNSQTHGGGGGGGLCTASCSCCGGHACRPIGCGHFGLFPMQYWPQPPYAAFPPLEAPPWPVVGIPSAPPLPETDKTPTSPPRPLPLPPPPGTNPFYTVFSDDNTSSICTII